MARAPKRLSSTYALDEGGERLWQRTAVALDGHDGHVTSVVTARAGPAPDYHPVRGTEAHLPAELVLIAIGFSGPERAGPIEQLRLRLTARGAIDAPAFVTSSRACTRPVTRGAASRSLSGRSPRDAAARASSTATYRSSPATCQGCRGG